MIKRYNPKEPYNNLPKLPPKKKLETLPILKQLINSSKVLAELKGYSEVVPNKNLLVNSIILQEAKDSSEIENIVTTQDALYTAIATNPKKLDPAVKEVLNYRSALWKGFSLIKQKMLLTTNMIIAIQEELEQNNAGIRKLPGTALINEKTGTIIYTPPAGEKVIRDLLKNLEEYINSDDDTNPLIKMAVIHYQFESIHPFYDGNGRTGRIINVLYLVLKELLDEPLLYLSRYIIQNKSDYYRLLLEVTQKENWEDWVIFMLKAIEDTAASTLALCKSIVDIMEKTQKKIQKKLPKIYSYELVKLLFANVYIRISNLVDNKIASRNIASSYLKELERIKVLSRIEVGKEVIYINEQLYKLLKKNNMH